MNSDVELAFATISTAIETEYGSRCEIEDLACPTCRAWHAFDECKAALADAS